MFPLLDLLLAAAAFLGHFALAVWLFNRLHVMPWPCSWIRGLERLLLLVAMTVPLVFLAIYIVSGRDSVIARDYSPAAIAWMAYPVICWFALVAAIPLWVIPKLLQKTPTELLSNDTSECDIAAALGYRPVGDRKSGFYSRIPGNEIFRLHTQRKLLRVARLPQALEGLTIAHLSDLHMCGRITQPFYDAIVDRTNELEPDLIVITGDIAEKAACLPWIVPTLGRLRAKHGKFFILGNHEMRLGDAQPLRELLVEAGLIGLAGTSHQIEIRGTTLLLAGIELPWFGVAPKVETNASQFRILLTHSPDQYPFARKHDFDLLLAGHTHGGQIRIPYIGALISPSHYGFRYASGVFYEAPTLLHVSRGLAGLHQLRFNCPPELPLLTLTRSVSEGPR